MPTPTLPGAVRVRALASSRSAPSGVLPRMNGSAVVVVLALQAAMLFVALLAVRAHGPAAPLGAGSTTPSAAAAAAAAPASLAASFAARLAQQPLPTPVTPSIPGIAHAGPVMQVPVPRAFLETPWSNRQLDESAQRLERELRWSSPDLRVLADHEGRLSGKAESGLRAGRVEGDRLGDKLGLAGARADRLSEIVLSHMLRRVTMRAAPGGSRIDPRALDAAARKATLTDMANDFDDTTRDAVAAALPDLPDLTTDGSGG